MSIVIEKRIQQKQLSEKEDRVRKKAFPLIGRRTEDRVRRIREKTVEDQVHTQVCSHWQMLLHLILLSFQVHKECKRRNPHDLNRIHTHRDDRDLLLRQSIYQQNTSLCIHSKIEIQRLQSLQSFQQWQDIAYTLFETFHSDMIQLDTRHKILMIHQRRFPENIQHKQTQQLLDQEDRHDQRWETKMSSQAWHWEEYP